MKKNIILHIVIICLLSTSVFSFLGCSKKKKQSSVTTSKSNPKSKPVVLQKIQISPGGKIYIETASSKQLKAIGVYSNVTTKDLTQKVTWKENSPFFDIHKGRIIGIRQSNGKPQELKAIIKINGKEFIASVQVIIKKRGHIAIGPHQKKNNPKKSTKKKIFQVKNNKHQKEGQAISEMKIIGTYKKEITGPMALPKGLKTSVSIKLFDDHNKEVEVKNSITCESDHKGIRATAFGKKTCRISIDEEQIQVGEVATITITYKNSDSRILKKEFKIRLTEAVLRKVEIVERIPLLPIENYSKQLHLKAFFSDGTTRDMTQKAVWTSSIPKIVYVENDPHKSNRGEVKHVDTSFNFDGWSQDGSLITAKLKINRITQSDHTTVRTDHYAVTEATVLLKQDNAPYKKITSSKISDTRREVILLNKNSKYKIKVQIEYSKLQLMPNMEDRKARPGLGMKSIGTSKNVVITENNMLSWSVTEAYDGPTPPNSSVKIAKNGDVIFGKNAEGPYEVTAIIRGHVVNKKVFYIRFI